MSSCKINWSFFLRYCVDYTRRRNAGHFFFALFVVLATSITCGKMQCVPFMISVIDKVLKQFNDGTTLIKIL